MGKNTKKSNNSAAIYLIGTFFDNKYDFTYVGERATPAKIQIQDFMRNIAEFGELFTMPITDMTQRLRELAAMVVIGVETW